MFKIYLELGYDHILDLNAYDHILFVLTLCAVYALKDWKKIFILVTAFTLGHSLTLALSVLEILKVNPSLIETLIPITIIVTALTNIFYVNKNQERITSLYVMAAFFGLIHGLGFSNYLKAILGDEDSVLLPLFAFNIGVELGQMLIVFLGLLLNFILISLLHIKLKYWTIVISVIAIIISTYLLLK
jgi:hypothetical protein